MRVNVENVGRVRILDAHELLRTMREHATPAYKQLLQQLHGTDKGRLDQALQCFISEQQRAVFILNGYDLIATARACRSADPAIIWVHDVVVADSVQGKGLGRLVLEHLELQVCGQWCKDNTWAKGTF